MRVKATGLAMLTASALLTTACGSSGGSSDDKASAPAPNGSSASAAASSALQRAALAQGDVPGYQVSADTTAQGRARPRADRGPCQPLADIMGDQPNPQARETVNRGLGSQRKLGLAVAASLSGYARPDAEKLVRDLRAAVAACSGFKAELGGTSSTYARVKARPYRIGGDESVSWSASSTQVNVETPVHIVVVRQGATIVRFMTINLGAPVQGRAQELVEVPRDVADKQLEKVRRVLG
ncbi:hypothetical protein A8W25_18985 [Streptomyces sp. ERV7]|uniref:hypothetical protein n=1 Tax=Streptomyces sp. ERV7 TaxID=1322334 RepID=UPI0007F45F0C|nr:hypothetical protein [Streptomyces sp. ERV7]OAR24481.1 hypothetical protein A8W25_18985 [Streptomyces sp. ERV7]